VALKVVPGIVEVKLTYYKESDLLSLEYNILVTELLSLETVNVNCVLPSRDWDWLLSPILM